jgi:hypothetical protein
MKTCNKCKISKELINFGKRVDTIDGKLSFCKDCQKEYALKYAKENPNKICVKCNTEKLISEFPKAPNSLKGVNNSCNECNRPRMKSYWDKTKAISNENRKVKNLSLTKIHELRRRSRQSRETHFIQRMFTRAKQRSLKNNLEFNIELNDIIIPEKCPLLNIKLVFGTKDNYKFSPSLDRIDSSKGYIKGNIQVISMLANTMKNNASKEQLIEFSINILKFYDIV